VSADDLLAILNAKVKNGSPVAANRVRALVSRIFSFAAEQRLLPPTASPVIGVKKPTKEASRDRVLTRQEIRRICDACDIAMAVRGESRRSSPRAGWHRGRRQRADRKLEAAARVRVKAHRMERDVENAGCCAMGPHVDENHLAWGGRSWGIGTHRRKLGNRSSIVVCANRELH
jgi:hypothetical protein